MEGLDMGLGSDSTLDSWSKRNSSIGMNLSKNKRKASIGDPAPAQQKARKAKTNPEPYEGSDEEMRSPEVQERPKPKPKRKAKSKKATTSSTQADPKSGKEVSDVEEQHDSGIEYTISSRINTRSSLKFLL